MNRPSLDRDAWAEVRAHGQITRYRCCGAGRAVLLLGFPTAAGGALRALLAELQNRYRLILPELPADAPDPAAWLSNFLEGLGLVRVRLVAAGSHCMPALELALLEPEQVERVVLLPEGAGTVAGRGAALETHVPRERVPLLVVRAGSEAELLARVAAFLETDGVAGVA